MARDRISKKIHKLPYRTNIHEIAGMFHTGFVIDSSYFCKDVQYDDAIIFIYLTEKSGDLISHEYVVGILRAGMDVQLF